jgi:hypothetical protein
MAAERKSRRELAETIVLIRNSQDSVPQVFGGYRSRDQDLPPRGSPSLNQIATGSIQYVWVASAHQPAAIDPDVRLDEPRTAALMSMMLTRSSPRPTATKQLRAPQRGLNTKGLVWLFAAVTLRFRSR